MTTRNDQLARNSAAEVAIDQLEWLIRWCRDPIVAEPMEGVDGFADCLIQSEAALALARQRGWASGIEWQREETHPGRGR